MLTKGGHRIHCLKQSVISNCSECSLCNALAVACGGFCSPVSLKCWFALGLVGGTVLLIYRIMDLES